MEQINELIRQQIGEIIMREVSLKGGVFLTVAKVDTSKDLRYTRISLGIYPETETRYVLESLRKELFGIQGSLNKKLHLRPLPRIQFVADSTEQEADEVEKILHKIHSEKNEE